MGKDKLIINASRSSGISAVAGLGMAMEVVNRTNAKHWARDDTEWDVGRN